MPAQDGQQRARCLTGQPKQDILNVVDKSLDGKLVSLKLVSNRQYDQLIGKQIDMPLAYGTLKQAERVKESGAQQKALFD